MSGLRVVIADDEPMALAKLRRLLSLEDDVEIVAECTDGASAAHAIGAFAPDIVFLDVEMPERDGFDALARGRVGTRPVVVFVTAFENYAVRAFDVSAADYLLKPFGAERLRKALERARERLNAEPTTRRVDAAAPAGETEPEGELGELRGDRLVFRSGGRVMIVPLDEVEWIEGMGNYVGVHTASSRVLMRVTMSALEARLDRTTFVRIHRSAIVNADYIREVKPSANHARTVTMGSGARLRVSRTCRGVFKGVFGESSPHTG